MDEQMKKWVMQSTSDELFFAMTDEELNERANRLAHKELNGIYDEDVRAAEERVFKTIGLLACRRAIKKLGKFLKNIYSI